MKHIMEGFDKFISYKEAVNIFNSIKWEYPAYENVGINNSINRIIYNDILSNMDVPEFDKSAVDGYAVRSVDTLNASVNNPSKLTIIGSESAEEKFDQNLNINECIEVYTGSEIPQGADSVIKVEETERSGNYIYVYSYSGENKNIFKKGEDLSKNYRILKKGDKILPQHLAAMASVKINNVNVYKKIVIGIINTGNEIINKKIINSTGILLKNYYSRPYTEVVDGGICGDDEECIINHINKIIDKCNIIIITGGTSLGRRDKTTDAVSIIGSILFSGVAIKPGRTVALFNIKNKPVISVSGLPVAALISSLVFVNMYIKKISNFDIYDKINGILDENIHNKIGFTTFQICRAYTVNNRIHIKPLRTTGSGILSSIIYGNSIVMVPDYKEGIEAGNIINAYKIGDIEWD